MTEVQKYDPSSVTAKLVIGEQHVSVSNNLRLHELTPEQKQAIAESTKSFIGVQVGMLSVNVRSEENKTKQRELIEEYQRGLELLQPPIEDAEQSP